MHAVPVILVLVPVGVSGTDKGYRAFGWKAEQQPAFRRILAEGVRSLALF